MNQKQKDLLCKMLNDKAKKTRALLSTHFPALRDEQDMTGSYGRCRSLRDDVAKSLPKTIAARYVLLEKEEEKLEIVRDKLQARWDDFKEQIRLFCKDEQEKRNAADDKLDKAVAQAIIKIQFAEDAEEVQGLIEDLPTVDQLV